MRRIMLVLLVEMLMLAAAVPVIAQDNPDYVEPPVEGASDYVPPPDFAAQCAPVLQFGNTGNNQEAQGSIQYGSTEPSTELVCE